MFPTIPVMMVGALIADALVNAYTTYDDNKYNNKALNQSDIYVRNSFAENDRFWSDYYKNTGKRPLYPYRSGAINDISQLYNIDAMRQTYKNMGYRSLANIGASGAYGYGLYDSKTYHDRKAQGNHNYFKIFER